MQETEQQDAHFQSICAQVEREMQRLPIPGAVLGISYQGKEWLAGFGVTSLENPLPVTPETLFQVGSITKTYTATALMRLVEMNRLELDRPIRAYLPNLRLADESVAQRVTLRHLLTHTGGWVGDYFNDFGYGEDALAKMVACLADLEQMTPLGEAWSYNNSGFYLAGRLLEVLTGMTYERALAELLLKPLDLQRTFFFPEDVMTYRFVVGHEIVDRQPRVARPWPIGRASHAVGGITCSVGDLLRYARFQMGDGTTPEGVRLLKPETLALMQTPLFPSTGLMSIGLSWNISTASGEKFVGHGGATNGQDALLRMAPASQFAIAVLTNSDEGGSLTLPVVNAATQLFIGRSLPDATPMDATAEQLGEVTGRYEAAAQSLDISVQPGGLSLQLTPKGGFPTPDSPPGQAPPPVRMAFYAPDRLVVLDEPMKGNRAEIVRSPEGVIAWLRFGSRLHRRKTA